jgi:trk system potassium uptake protein TrkH
VAIFRPDADDLRLIGYQLGKVATGLSLLMVVPAVVALVLGEWNSATALIAGAGVCVTFGQLTEWRLVTRRPLAWSHGTVVVALAWLIGSVLAAIPFYLSGHTADLVDAWFEAMSGLTTSGLSVIQDLDHLSYSMNLYRHLTHFAGGQGIVIVVLAVFASGSGAGMLYVAEGREDRILPNIVRTARFIFTVAAVYRAVGTIAVFAALQVAGIGGWRGLWHAVNLFVAAFDTGGFAPTSRSIGYYHSATLEAVLLVLMIAGTMSFALHYHLWVGRFRELARNIEVRSLLITTTVLTVLALLGLARAGAFSDTGGLFRKGVFTVLSAHTGTGFGVNDGALFVTDWGVLAPAAVVLAMGLGGMAGSTAGGVKALRVGITAKAIAHDIRRILLPDNALVVTTYHSGRRQVLRDHVARSATTVLLLYGMTYLGGAGVALLYGRWELSEALFESVSAAANVGLSVGIVAPGMPRLLQLTYILQMWVGRLEFFAAFALIGYLVGVVRGRR